MEQEKKEKQKLSLFYSYAREDEDFVRELEKQLGVLKRIGVIETWHDRKIKAGESWEDRISESLESAQIILLIVSPDFIDSDYCYEKEMAVALQRHARNEATVIPVVVREVAFLEKTPFANIQMLPKDAKPVAQWQSRNQVWAEVARAIGDACEDLQNCNRRPATAQEHPEDETTRLSTEKIVAHLHRMQTERENALREAMERFKKRIPERSKAIYEPAPKSKMSEKTEKYLKS